MALNKDKDQNVSTDGSKTLAIKAKSNVVNSPVSSLDLANRFSSFSPNYLISYSSTLISPCDPFIDASKKFRVPGIDYKKPSAYVTLPFFQYLFSIEINQSSAKSEGELALSYFSPSFHWIPEHPLKNLTYYSNILLQTKSFHIKPIYCQTIVPKKIIYHSVYINTPISKKD